MTKEQRTETLKRLMIATDQAILIAQGVRRMNNSQFSGAINWADLRCSEALFVLNERGRERYQVLIEEADPANSDLHEFVNAQLKITGWTGVEIEVRTEW